jgi:hypothetical protein
MVKKHPADRAERRKLDEEKKARKDRAVKTVPNRLASSLSSDE